MAVTTITEVILHGVGTGHIIKTSGEWITMENLQDMNVESTVSEEDVFGGDSLYPIFDFIKEKGGKISVTNAVLTLEQMALAGAVIDKTTAESMLVEEVTITGGSGTLSVTSGIIPATAAAFDVSTGNALARVTSAPAADQFSVSATGDIDMVATFTGTIKINVMYTDGEAIAARFLNDSVPGFIEYRHYIETEMPDGNKYGVTLVAYKCKCDGKFSYDAKRGGAFAPKLDFKILDPKRSDKRYIDYNVKEVA